MSRETKQEIACCGKVMTPKGMFLVSSEEVPCDGMIHVIPTRWMFTYECNTCGKEIDMRISLTAESIQQKVAKIFNKEK